MLSESKDHNASRLSVWLCMAALSVGCTHLQNPQPINIGLMNNMASGEQLITETGTHFHYQPNGMCSQRGESVPCMWWGVEIGYDTSQDFTTLECQSIKTIDPEPGNKRSLFTASKLQYRWETLLPPHSNRQTIGMNISNSNNTNRGLITIETNCRAKNIRPFAFSVSIDFRNSNKSKQD